MEYSKEVVKVVTTSQKLNIVCGEATRVELKNQEYMCWLFLMN